MPEDIIDKDKDKDNEKDLESEVIAGMQEKMKQMVSKEELEKERKKAEKYANLLINGHEERIEKKEVKDIAAMIEAHDNYQGTNRGYAQATVELLDALEDHEFSDRLMGHENMQQIRKVGNFFKTALTETETDAEFASYFERNTIDSNPQMSAKIAAAGGLASYLVKNNKAARR